MDAVIELAFANLLTPIVLFFVLGVFAGAVKSDLALPEAVSKGLSLYLMLAIGFKGGVELAHSGLGQTILIAMLAGIILGFVIPVIAYVLLKVMARIDSINAAAISAHYGSISVVTFVAATGFLAMKSVTYDGYMVALMALMETPAIIAGLILARVGMVAADKKAGAVKKPLMSRELAHEVFLSGSIVLLMGAFVIGWTTGTDGMEIMSPMVEVPFKAVLAVFLLDMGLLVGRRIGDFKAVGLPLVAFGIIMPLIGAAMGLGTAVLLGMPLGSGLLLMVLAGSASYIVVPAAMRLSLPKANPAIYVTLSLAVTFPFNLLIGIPLYFAVAQLVLMP